MGSLMSGWNTNIKDPKKVLLERNKSLTKEEIAAYRKSTKSEDDADENQENIDRGAVKRIERSNTVPLTNRRESTVITESESGGDKMKNKISCWWTRSNSAFLNEPPVMATEGQNKYVPQHNVANYGSSKMSTCSS